MKSQKVVLVAISDPAPVRTPLVAVIDDSSTVRRIMEVGLRRAGMHVISFADGVCFFEYLMMPRIPLPHLVILDIGLPKMDGFEVARRFKARPRFQATPIIILTRRAGLFDRLKGRIAGACIYMIKPFRIEEVTRRVMALLAASGQQDVVETPA